MKTFKIQSGPLNCNLEKVLYLLYLLKFKKYGEAPCIGEARTKFRYRFNNYKNKLSAFRKRNLKNTSATSSQSFLSGLSFRN